MSIITILWTFLSSLIRTEIIILLIGRRIILLLEQHSIQLNIAIVHD